MFKQQLQSNRRKKEINYFNKCIKNGNNGIFYFDNSNYSITYAVGTRNSNGAIVNLSFNEISNFLLNHLINDNIFVFNNGILIDDDGKLLGPTTEAWNGDMYEFSYTDKLTTSTETVYAQIASNKITIDYNYMSASKVNYTTESMSIDATIEFNLCEIDSNFWFPMPPIVEITDLGAANGMKIDAYIPNFNFEKPTQYKIYAYNALKNDQYQYIATVNDSSNVIHYIDNSAFARNIKQYDFIFYRVYAISKNGQYGNPGANNITIYGRSWF